MVNFKCFVLAFITASIAGANFDSEPKTPKNYDHLVFKFIVPYQYKKQIEQISEPFIAIHKESDGKENKMHLIHHGVAAMYKRLEMLDRAQKSIEIEYFIYSPKKKNPSGTETSYELATKIINNKLIEKAIQGVAVRLLVDASVAIWQFDDYFVTASKEAVKRGGGNPDNFQVRYYNSSSVTGKFSQFRSHRKLFVIDDVEAITGGRNIEDKYFDLDHKYNFLDRDIWVKGSVVPTMRASFDAFWNAGVTGKPKEIYIPSADDDLNVHYDISLKTARDFTVYTEHDQEAEKKIRELGEQLYNTSQTHSCPKTVFASDRPLDTVFTRWCIYGKLCKGDGYKEDYRFTERAIGTYLRTLKADDELLIDSPYFMLNTRSGNALKMLSEKKVKMSVLTNSLGSTDALYAASGWYRELLGFVNVGVKAFVHSSKVEPDYQVIDENVLQARWGTHSKTQVFGDNAFFVGTFNVDNRSSFYNAEMGLICEGSRELTADVKDNIKSRIKKASYRITEDGTSVDANGEDQQDTYGGAGGKQQAIMNAISLPVWLLQFLM